MMNLSRLEKSPARIKRNWWIGILDGANNYSPVRRIGESVDIFWAREFACIRRVGAQKENEQENE